jgi:iron(III) transport system substrate-binding protein
MVRTTRIVSTPGRTRVAMVAAVLASALALGGCGGTTNAQTEAGAPVRTSEGQWNAIVEAAKKEGRVVVYSSMVGVETTFAAFSEKYPEITVQVERAPTTEIIARLDQEVEVGAAGADVTMHSSAAWYEARDADGAFAALQVSPGEQAEGWMERLGGGYAGVYASPFLVAWNTAHGKPIANAGDVAGLPKVGLTKAGLADAIDYQYKGWLDEFGSDFLNNLAKNKATTYGSNAPAAQALASGEIDYLIGTTPATLIKLKEDGAPVDMVVPDRGAVGVLYNAAVLRNAPNPNAAQVFTNWLMSKDGASRLVKSHAPAATPVKVEGSLTWGEITTPGTDWTTERNHEWIDKEWRPYFG